MLLDGATGTQLKAAGMPEFVCPEQWILDNPDKLTDLQRCYIDAGCDVLYTPTFGANRIRLSGYGIGEKADEINRRLAWLTCRLAELEKSRQLLTAGCIAPTGLKPAPWGDTSFSTFEQVFWEQASALQDAGVDMLVCETMTSLTEARAALIAARNTGLPVIVTLTVDKEGKTLSGARFLPAVITLQSLGAAAVGLNCSVGIAGMAEQIAEALPHASVPLVAKPSAMGEDGEMSPARFADKMKPLLEAGAVIVGGCCGTTPEHIAMLRGMLDRHPIIVPREIDSNACAVDSEAFFLTEDIEFSEPITCDSDLADRLIEAEEWSNAALIHIGIPDDIDKLLEFGGMSRIPLAIHTDSAILLDDTLRRFPGRLIVDSLCEIDKPLLEDIAARYGAVVF